MAKSLSNRQFLDMLQMAFSIDGSAVGTSLDNAGLLNGQHIAKVMKGTSSDSNLVTVQFNLPLGMDQYAIFIQERTLDCVARVETQDKNGFAIRTLELDGVTKEDDADFDVLVVGTQGVYEGSY